MDEFRTRRLRWRPPRAGDVDAYMTFVSDYEVVKWTATWPYPADRDFVASRCVPVAADLGFAGPVFFGEEMIGGVGLIDREFGFFFARLHCGQGHATEIGRAAISRAFQFYDWDHIVATVMQGNTGSARVLEKLGFRPAGTTRCTSNAQGKDVAATEYHLTRKDWLASAGPNLAAID